MVNNVKVYYEYIGNEKNQPIICIHTAGRDSRQWHQFMELLQDKYFLIAPDLPGHSKSWPISEVEPSYDNAENIGKFIIDFTKQFHISKPIYIGCSMGGNIMFEIAAQYPNIPKAVISLQGADYTPSFSSNSLETITNPYVNYPFSNFDFSTSLIGSRINSTNRTFLEYTIFQFHPYALYGDLKAYTNFDVRNKMQNISCPVLMIRGKEDWLVPHRFVKGTYNRLINTSKKELIEVDGLGHFPHVEDPVIISKLVKDFLKKHVQVVQ